MAAMKSPLHTVLYLFLVGTLFLNFTLSSNPNATFSALERAFTEGDAKKITAQMDDKLLLEINKSESVYSKSQAELILKDFFEKNRPKTFTTKSKSNLKGNYAMLGTLISESNKEFRVSIKLREQGSQFALDRISINPN